VPRPVGASQSSQRRHSTSKATVAESARARVHAIVASGAARSVIVLMMPAMTFAAAP